MEGGATIAPLSRLGAWESASCQALFAARNQRLQRIVAGKLKQDWSPQQIAGWLKDQYPGHPEIGCHTKRFTAVFSFRLAESSKRAHWAPSLKTADRRPHHAVDGRTESGSSEPSRYAKDQRRSRIERFPATGGRSCGGLSRNLHCNTGRTTIALCGSGQTPEKRTDVSWTR